MYDNENLQGGNHVLRSTKSISKACNAHLPCMTSRSIRPDANVANCVLRIFMWLDFWGPMRICAVNRNTFEISSWTLGVVCQLTGVCEHNLFRRPAISAPSEGQPGTPRRQ